MIVCVQCQTPNVLDSLFCRKCGADLPELEREEQIARLENLVAEGNLSLNEGRTEEALAVADSALRSHPSLLTALHLRCAANTRLGNLAAALEDADAILELDPDSELDKIRRAQLRKELTASLNAPSGPDRRTALVAALAAVVLVVSLGAFAIRMATQTTEKPNLVASNGLDGALNPNAQFFNGGQATGQGNPPVADPAPPVDPNAVTQPAVPPVATPNPPVTATPTPAPVIPRGGVGGSLPQPGVNGETTIEPFRPGAPPSAGLPDPNRTPNPAPNNNQTRGNQGDPDPVATTPNPNPPPQEEVDPGLINIQVKRPNQGNTGGGAPANPTSNPAGGATALSRTGDQFFGAGDFSAAIGAYQKALAAGGNPIRLNERIGDAYKRLGDTGAANAHYQQALVAAQAALSRSPNSESLRRTVAKLQALLQ